MKLSHVQLTKELFVPIGFSLKKTLNQQLHPGIQLKTHQAGILCKYKKVDFLIPYNMVECAVVDPSEKAFKE
jgi:hypothetical protein